MPRIALRFTGIAVLLLAICSSLVWYKLPDLALVVGRAALSNTGIELVAVKIPRQHRLPLQIEALSLAASNLTISISKAQLSPLTPWANAWQLDLDSVTLAPIDLDLSTVATSIADSLDNIRSVLTWLPERGQIKRYSYCNVECFTGDLHWQRIPGGVELQVTLKNWGLLADLSITSDALQVTVFTDVQAGHSALDPHRLGEALGFPLPAHWILFGQVTAPDPNSMVMTGTLDLGSMKGTIPIPTPTPTPTPILEQSSAFSSEFALDSSQTQFSVQVPATTPATVFELWRLAEFELSTKANGFWRIARGPAEITSRSELRFSATHSPDNTAARLDQALLLNFTNTDLTQGIISVGEGANCRFSEQVECAVPLLKVQGGLAESLSEITSAPNSETAPTPVSYELEFKDVNLAYQQPAWSAAGTVYTRIKSEDQGLLASGAIFNLADNILIATSETTQVLTIPLRKVTLMQDLSTGQGELSAEFSSPVLPLVKSLSFAVHDGLRVKGGLITGTTKVNWQTGSTLPRVTNTATTIRLSNTDFDYSDYQFSGLFLDLQLAGWPHPKSVQRGQLRLKTLDIGIPITDISASFDLALNSDTLHAKTQGERLTAHLLGGEATSNEFQFETQQLSGFARMQLKDLALQKMLNLGRDDFDSSGKISGSVPLHIEQGRISVAAGKLFAESPGGHLRYSPDSTTRELLMGSDKTKVVLDTLSDFQYHHLSAVFDYSTAGNLIAKTRIQGRNPLYDQGREIHFNLSIEENLGTLLESLRMGEDVEKKVQAGSTLIKERLVDKKGPNNQLIDAALPNQLNQ